MNVTFPALSKIFNEPLGVVQWITTGYLLVVTITMCTTGFLLKKFNLKSLFIVACSAFLIGDLLCSIAPSFWILLLGRLVMGIAMGLSFTMVFEIIFVQVPKHKVGLYTGIPLMTIAFARAIGPTYGGYLSSLLSWRLIFLITLPLGLITLLIGMKSINQPAPGEKKKFSFSSLFFLAITLFAFVLAANQFGIKGSSIWLILGIVAIGVVSFLIFIYLNDHGDSTLLEFRPLRVPVVSLNLINYAILMFINVAISFLIPIYAITVMNASPLVAGLILLPGSVVGGIASPVSGWVYDRFGAFVPIFFGLIVLVIATFMFSALSAFFTPLFLTIVYILLRIGLNSAIGNSMTNAEMFTPKSETADMNAIFNIALQYAGALGTAILAAVLSFSQNKATTPAQFVTKTMEGGKLDFLILFILAVVATVVAFFNWKIQANSKKELKNEQSSGK